MKKALKNLNKLQKEKTSKGEKICSIEDIENYFDVDRNLKKTRKSGDFFTNIPEPKNIMTFLGHRLERFVKYQREIVTGIGNSSDKEKLQDYTNTNIILPDKTNQSDINNSKQSASYKHKLNSSFNKSDFNNSFDECIPKHKMSYSFIIKENPFFDEKYYSNSDKKDEKKDKKDKKDKNQKISDVIDNLLESF